MTVIDVVLFGNLVQSIDARISTFKMFRQFSPGSHVLIARPMKFDAGFSQPFLNVYTPSSLGSRAPPPFPGDRFFLGTGFHFQSLS